MSYQLQPGLVPARAHAHLLSLGAGAKVATAVLAEAIDADAGSLAAILAYPREQGVFVAERRKDGPGMLWSIGRGTPIREQDKPFRRDLDDDQDTGAAPAGPARNGSQTPDDAAAIPGARAGSDTEGRDSQHVLKAEPERADATDRETSADASPRVGATGAGQAADAAATGRKARKAKPPRTAGKKPGKAKPAPLPPKARAYVKAIEQRLPPDPPPVELTPTPPPQPFRCGAFSDGTFVQEKNGASIVLERFEFETLLRFLTRMCAEEGA